MEKDLNLRQQPQHHMSETNTQGKGGVTQLVSFTELFVWMLAAVCFSWALSSTYCHISAREVNVLSMLWVRISPAPVAVYLFGCQVCYLISTSLLFHGCYSIAISVFASSVIVSRLSPSFFSFVCRMELQQNTCGSWLDYSINATDKKQKIVESVETPRTDFFFFFITRLACSLPLCYFRSVTF